MHILYKIKRIFLKKFKILMAKDREHFFYLHRNTFSPSSHVPKILTFIGFPTGLVPNTECLFVNCCIGAHVILHTRVLLYSDFGYGRILS